MLGLKSGTAADRGVCVSFASVTGVGEPFPLTRMVSGLRCAPCADPWGERGALAGGACMYSGPV